MKKVIKDVSYKLALPRIMRIHPVFHISLLEPAHPKTPIRLPPELHPETQEEEYEVEKILAVRKRRNQLQWLVKWKDYQDEHNTWEPKRHLSHCGEEMQKFYRQNPQALR